MKKLFRILSVFALSISLVACSGNDFADAPNEEFDQYVETLPGLMFDNTDYDLNYMFENKENFGYKEALYELSVPTREEYEEGLEETEKIYKEIKDFSRKSLTKEQQLTYDVLLDAFDISSEVDDDASYYLNTNYLDSVYGEPSNLPLSLYFYTFRNKQDVDSYLNLLTTSENYFVSAAKHEQKRQDAGYGMTPSEIDVVIKQCDDFLAEEQRFLLDSFDEKIQDVKELTSSEKAEYIKKNKEYVQKDFMNAYKSLKKELQALDIKTKKNEGYASIYDGGKEYYAELIHNYTGFETVEEYREYLKGKEKEILDEMYELIFNNSDLYELIESGEEFNVLYSKHKNPTEVLKYLEEAMEEDFPKLRSVEYEMETVPKSMQSIVSAAAMYFISPVDTTEAKEKMLLNGSYKQEDFTTIAHEGYPGHMYQKQYYKEVDAPVIRQLLGYSGYSEGYANYTEHYSVKYAEDSALAKLMSLNEQYFYVLTLEIDCSIHYDGNSEKQVKKEIDKAYEGGASDDDIDAIYEQLLHSPAVFSKYYGSGFRIRDLSKKMQEELGDEYTDMNFHKALLDVGASPYHIMEEYITNTLLN